MFNKRILSIVVTIILLLSLTFSVNAENNAPVSLEAPRDTSLRQDTASIIYLRWTNPTSILKLTENIENGDYQGLLTYLIDFKVNNGNWNVAIPFSDSRFDDNINGQFTFNMRNILKDEKGTSETFFAAWHLDSSLDSTSNYDLANNTYYFRMRYLFESNDDSIKPIYSPYSEVIAIGKNAGVTSITKLDAPKNLKVQVKKNSSNKPYFQLDWEIPESVSAANKQLPVYHFIDFKVEGGKWLSETTKWDGMPGATANLLVSNDTINPVEVNIADGIKIEENTYYFRVGFVCEPPMGAPVLSEYSNVASTKMEAYSDASTWAKPELDEANEKGLIPQSLIGVDMKKPITREEFAELAVVLYEKTTKTTISPETSNPFKDTTNPEILKAYKVGITEGTSKTTFDPKKLTNREQVATMLSRTIRKMVPNGDYSTKGAPSFTDQKDISKWALEHVLYMAKQEIIKGTNGKFMPKAITTAEIASGYATTTREQAIAMSLRTFNNIMK